MINHNNIPMYCYYIARFINVPTYFIYKNVFRFLKLYSYVILYCIVTHKVVRYYIEVLNREDRYGPDMRMLFVLLYNIIYYCINLNGFFIVHCGCFFINNNYYLTGWKIPIEEHVHRAHIIFSEKLIKIKMAFFGRSFKRYFLNRCFIHLRRYI